MGIKKMLKHLNQRHEEIWTLLKWKGWIYTILIGSFSGMVAGSVFVNPFFKLGFGLILYFLFYFKGFELIKEISKQSKKVDIGKTDWIVEDYLKQ